MKESTLKELGKRFQKRCFDFAQKRKNFFAELNNDYQALVLIGGGDDMVRQELDSLELMIGKAHDPLAANIIVHIPRTDRDARPAATPPVPPNASNGTARLANAAPDATPKRRGRPPGKATMAPASTKGELACHEVAPHVVAAVKRIGAGVEFQVTDVFDILRQQNVKFNPGHVSLILSKGLKNVRKLPEKRPGKNSARPCNVYTISGRGEPALS